jgi:hypothetical protein
VFPNGPCGKGLVLSVVLLGSGKTFKRRALMWGLWWIIGVSLKGTANSSLFFSFFFHLLAMSWAVFLCHTPYHPGLPHHRFKSNRTNRAWTVTSKTVSQKWPFSIYKFIVSDISYSNGKVIQNFFKYLIFLSKA